jgi:hypothetical protein
MFDISLFFKLLFFYSGSLYCRYSLLPTFKYSSVPTSIGLFNVICGVTVTDGVTDEVGVLEGVTVLDGVTVTDGVTDDVGVLDVVTVLDGVTDEVGVLDGVTVTDGVGVKDGVIDGVTLGVTDGVGVIIGLQLGHQKSNKSNLFFNIL